MNTLRLLFPALAVLAMAAPVPFAMPAFAQRSERVVTIFGSDPCPTSNGEEIVVCQRRPEAERYRIPEELRRTEARDATGAGERSATLESTGRSGAMSCSASGSAGASGCFREQARKACEEAKAQGKKCGIGF